FPPAKPVSRLAARTFILLAFCNSDWTPPCPVDSLRRDADSVSEWAEPEPARHAGAGEVRQNHTGGNRGAGAEAGGRIEGHGRVPSVECGGGTGELDPRGEG